ncbi:mitochondrial protein Pet127-domain-containing protein [Coniella lustricola]|uniref:Mitochondrial protein Pet127-domain-containing protein n=1 Tax=Coniella lustricola TaxID=2025994 RepID=A0A2T3AF02_9PEZI|nr:mitochondrial protein Pet127-domain-containing protein [Coniella lustricola]
MVKLKAQQRDSNKSIATKDAAEKTSKDSVEKASKDSAEKAIKDSAEKVTLRQKLSEGGSVAVKTRTPSAPPVPPVSLRAFKPRRVLGASLPNVRDAASKVVGEAAAARPRRRLEADSPSGLPRRPKSFFNEAEDENEKFGTPVHKFRPDSAAALTPIEAYTPPVPMVSYGLDRVLFNEGVYALQDPRTKVWNFDPYLAKIMPVDEFDFDALKEYITSSKDTLLMGITKKHNKKYTGSTSSMTSTMAHFHYLLSAWRPINTGRLSKDFQIELESFAAIQRAPAATFLNHRDGTYAIDADKQFDSDTILSMLGKSMEKLLTVPKDEFEKYRRSNSHQLTEEEKDQDESYHYTTYGDFMMRSQLDAYDPRLPGTGIFDLKTRAVVSIRMDALNYTKGMGYEIRQRLGQWESFEREYFDMMRAAFLKYSLQVRMGRMDGIFVAYHNTQRIFGFQYIPLEEMDSSMHGTMDKTLGDAEFTASLKLWNELLNKATERFPGQSLRVHVETRPSDQVPLMYFFAEPVTDDEIKQIQERKKEDVDKFREEVLRIPPLPEAEAAEEEPPVAEQDLQEAEEEDGGEVWEDIMEVVEKTMDNDAQGITAIREAIGDALEQSGLLRARSSEEAQGYIESLLKLIVDVDAESTRKEADVDTDTPDSVLGSAEAKTNSTEVAKSSITDEPASQNTAAMESTPADTAAQATDTSAAELKTPEQKEGDEVDGNPEPKPIFGMVLTIRNKLNGKPVDRVEDLKPSDHWQVEYRMEEITDQDKARALYKGVQTRRRAAFFRDPMASDRFDAFGGALKKYTASGRKFRQTEDKDAKKKPVWIMGKSDPEDFKTVFSGAGISLDYVTPNPTKVEETGAVHSETGAVHSETASKEQSSATDSSATVEVREVSESEQIGERNVLQATTTASFREWRAQSKTADK